MDAGHFDHLTLAQSSRVSRRAAIQIGALAISIAGIQPAPTAQANDKRRRRRRRNRQPELPVVEPTPNAYGCLSVGQPCGGHHELCCSEVCEGPLPQKGKPDARVCAAHNTGDCVAAQDSCLVEKNVPCLSNGVCTQTTGEANFCARLAVGECMACKTDADCTLWGPGAACIVCPYACPQSSTACFAAAA